MDSESQKKEFAAARETLYKATRTFDSSKLDPKVTAEAQQKILNNLRERFADLFLTKDADQRNNDVYYCLMKGICKEQEKKLVSCFMKAEEEGSDVSEACGEDILEMKTCVNKCLFKLMEKKMDFLRLMSDIPYYYSS